MALIQTDQQIRGHISWLHTHDASEAPKVMHEVIAFAWRQAKDVNEVKQSILHGNMGSLLAGDVIHQGDLVQILLRWLEERRLSLIVGALVQPLREHRYVALANGAK